MKVFYEKANCAPRNVWKTISILLITFISSLIISSLTIIYLMIISDMNSVGCPGWASGCGVYFPPISSSLHSIRLGIHHMARWTIHIVPPSGDEVVSLHKARMPATSVTNCSLVTALKDPAFILPQILCELS